ncbi:MAG: alpha/beta hydrolase [Solirubrobacteraceae bacterium]|jgi:pimeloyl-ACP methyl ester carboxylesterase
MILPSDDLGSGPAVVLLHAGVADRRMWTGQRDVIAAAGFRVLAFDLPGFGEAKPRGELAPWSDVLETMDAIGVRRAALVGNSFGGSVALSVAVVAPQRVTALVLVSAPPPDLTPSPLLQAAWDAEGSALQRGDVAAAVRAVVDAWTLPDAPIAIREQVAATQRRAFELELAAGDLREADDPLTADPGALRRLGVRTLVAVGELDMPDFRSGAEQLARELPDARQVTISGAGHLAPLEQPASFSALVLDFLAGQVR